MKGEKERECVCAWKQDGNVANHHKNTRSGKMLIGVARICRTAPFKRAPIFFFPIERFSYQRRKKPDISAFQSLRKVEENCTYLSDGFTPFPYDISPDYAEAFK